MSRTSFYTLHELLRPYIQKKSTQFREPIPSECRLAIFLYHITLGATFLAISNQFASGKSTVCRIVLCSVEFWFAKTEIPDVVVCLDGCHIHLHKVEYHILIGRGFTVSMYKVLVLKRGLI